METKFSLQEILFKTFDTLCTW